MNIVPETNDLAAYLKASDILDYNSSAISKLAEELSSGVHDEVELAQKAFEFVRDKISHSNDIGGEVVTCNASDVLFYKHGLCYAKSHLLAAILRKLGIPVGFCYQRLSSGVDDNNKLVLHGLNAIYLRSLDKWIRVDARGNKEGVNAEFSTDNEKLAYKVCKELGEEEEPTIFSVPNEKVVRALRNSKTVTELMDDLPSNL